MHSNRHILRFRNRTTVPPTVGRALLYDGRPAIVSKVSDGEYGERVTFEVGGSTITTTPGLDPRFSWV